VALHVLKCHTAPRNVHLTPDARHFMMCEFSGLAFKRTRLRKARAGWLRLCLAFLTGRGIFFGLFSFFTYYSLSYEDAEFPANTGQIQGITGVDESGTMVKSRKLFTRGHPETPDDTCSFRFGKEGFFVPARKSRACAEAYMGTASQSVEIGDRARRSLCGHRRRQWPSRLAVPPPQGGKGPFPDGN
jgi:hypothetical protein